MNKFTRTLVAVAIAALGTSLHAEGRRIGPTVALHVSIAGGIEGTIVGQGVGINCPTTAKPRSRCDVQVIVGTQVTLTAVPAPGKFFGAWQAGSVCAGQGETCSFVMPSHPDGTVVSFSPSPPATQICNGQVIICPCACVPQLCRIAVEYTLDSPNSPNVIVDPTCPRLGAGEALDSAADQFIP